LYSFIRKSGSFDRQTRWQANGLTEILFRAKKSRHDNCGKLRQMLHRALTGCCPNKNSFERSLKRFLRINLGEAEDQRFELFEPEGRFRPSEKGFGQQPVNVQP
jgi:hypothetical protein